jgi:acyl-CoA synthetase (AMP-forming)/AMP-acid ligase II
MLFRSAYPEVDIPDVPLTPFVFRRAAEIASKPALVDGPTGRTLSYGQLDGAIRRAAMGLTGRGFGKGDVLALYSPNLPEYVIAFHAVSLIGGIVTTVNPMFTEGELAAQLLDAGARMLVTIAPLLPKAAPAAQRAGISELVVFGEADGAQPFAGLLEADGEVPQVAIDVRSDVVALPYSSGTTGLPKGVMLTHFNLVANICQTQPFLPSDPVEVLLGVLPFYHIYGLTVLMNIVLSHGQTLVTLPRFELPVFLETIQKYRVTRANLVPPIILALAKHPLVEQYDLSSLRSITSGAAPLDAALSEACASRLRCLVNQGYGLTETSPVTNAPTLDPQTVRPGSVGQLIPNTEARIVDVATGQDLDAGQDGEVWLRGPQVMKGYWKRPKETAHVIDAEGWLHSGDIGHFDGDGYLYIVDRVKELIKYKGYQVAPAELEALLLTHPAVTDAAVVPVPDPEAGEVPKAYVVLKQEVAPEEILDYVAQRVAPYKRIRRIEIVTEIPKATSGKILRRVLVERERARQLA